MHVTETPLQIELRDSEGRAMGVGRGEGLHLGEVITYMRMAVDKKFRAMKQAGDGGGELHMTMGFLFERLLTDAFANHMKDQRQVVRPPEVQLDGIYMNTDGINLADGGVEEYKATWKSAGPALKDGWQVWLERDAWYWLVQIKAYCRAWKASHAYLIVFFVCGDYRPPRPLLVMLRLDFEPGELEFNWEMVLNNAQDVREGKQAEVEVPKPEDSFDRRFES